MKKYLILLIVCITVALSFSVVAAGGLFGGDDVTVKKYFETICDMYMSLRSTPNRKSRTEDYPLVKKYMRKLEEQNSVEE